MRVLPRFLLLLCTFLAISLASAAEAPDVFVKRTLDEALEDIRQTKDRAALRKLAEQKAQAYFDFQQMTRLAVGVAWRKATPEQQKALEANFRTLLVNTYTNALAQPSSGARTVDVKPAAAASKDGDTVVRTQVRDSGRQPIAIDYRMHNRGGEWKVYDVTVEGVSLVTNYRTTFSEEVNKGGIDGLVRTLEQRNKTLSKG